MRIALLTGLHFGDGSVKGQGFYDQTFNSHQNLSFLESLGRNGDYYVNPEHLRVRSSTRDVETSAGTHLERPG